MKRISLLAAIGAVLFLGVNAFAQDQPTNWEVALDYSLLNFHPGNPGLLVDTMNMNGGGGSLTYYTPLHWLGVKADFQGYTNSTSNFTIPRGNAIIPQGGQLSVSADMFTYQFGPVVKLHTGRWQPYAQALFGGAHSNVYGDIFKNVLVLNPGAGATTVLNPTAAASTAPSNDAFAMNIGFGLDIRLSNLISIRPVEAGYQLTRFGNVFNGGDTQHSFRYVAGVVFHW